MKYFHLKHHLNFADNSLSRNRKKNSRSCDLSGEKFERIQCIQYETKVKDASSNDFYDEGTKGMCSSEEGKWSESPCEVPNHLIKCESAANSSDDQKVLNYFEPHYAAYLVKHRFCKDGQELRKQNDDVYALESWTAEIKDQDLTGSILGEKINSHYLRAKPSAFCGPNSIDIEFYFNAEVSSDLCFYYRDDIDTLGATGTIPNTFGTHYMRISEQNDFHRDVFSIMGTKHKKGASSSEIFRPMLLN